MSSDITLGLVVLIALSFDFTNGFHDTANVVASSISTHALAPKRAIAMASILNFVGAFISLKVATTIAKGFVATDAITMTVIFAALLGAITWNLITWYVGLPSSSSHAMIGGLVGAAVAAHGWHVADAQGLLTKLIEPALASPLIAFAAAWMAVLAVYRIVGRLQPGPVARGFRLGQLASGGLLALSHGTNDAQKTMGVIALALVAHGSIGADNFHVPTWVVVASASAISLGTYTGGWRIIKTMGTKIIKMDPAQGFVAQTAGATVILAASAAGYPLSTTHVITGGIAGAGAGKRLSAVRWGVAREIVTAWVLTLPCAGAVAALMYALVNLFGRGDGGIVVITIAAVVVLLVIFRRRPPHRPLTAAEIQPEAKTQA
jgi:inorganic phosphate transporter, PiT family